MKIAIVVRSNKLSGAERRAIKIARHLLSRKLDVELWISSDLKGLVDDSFPDMSGKTFVYSGGVANDRKVSIKNFIRSKIVQMVPSIIKKIWRRKRSEGINLIVNRRGIDILHVFLDGSIERVEGCQTIFELTSPDVVDHVVKWSFERKNAYNFYLCVSEGVRERIGSEIPQDKIGLPPSAYFFPDEPMAADFKKENIITFAHRMIPRKNGVLFAWAVKEFLSGEPDWRINIFGDGPDEDEIRSILASESASGRVFIGRKPNISSDLSASRIFVSIIEPDNYPSQSVLEAMYHGNALLLSDKGRTREKFFCDNGVFVELNVDAICQGLKYLVRDCEHLDQMGKSSRAFMGTRFNAEVYVDYLVDVYSSLNAGKASRRPNE